MVVPGGSTGIDFAIAAAAFCAPSSAERTLALEPSFRFARTAFANAEPAAFKFCIAVRNSFNSAAPFETAGAFAAPFFAGFFWVVFFAMSSAVPFLS
jgi:hypothetical protein